ncbi:hypothetical protein [Metapseudomonas otitidis]|nr:hypothetical protein [Pseudomonas otitidis]SFA60871.1 hypothetical protein SAMN05216263_10952 [Pseudomonas otitidis]
MLALTRFFDVSTGNASLHLKIFFEDGELSRDATTEESSVVQMAEQAVT